MATPNLVQIDDRNPLVFYSPNSSWTRGGNVADFDGTSTFTASPGASATLTFTGTGISVWGTITFLAPNTPTHVLSSYSIDGGPETTFSATEQSAFQFQQKYFQSATLTATTSHTLVVTATNNATFFIDYFLIIPATSSGAAASSSPSSPALPLSPSNLSPLASTGTVSPAGTPSKSSSFLISSSSTSSNSMSPTGAINHPDSSTLSSTLSTIATAGASSQSHSSRVSVGPVLGGTVGGLALIVSAFFAVWLIRKRQKIENRKNQSPFQTHDPLITPALPMQQIQPHEYSNRGSQYPIVSPYFQLPSSQTSSLGVIPPSKAANDQPSHAHGDSLYSSTRLDSPEPPAYYG